MMEMEPWEMASRLLTFAQTGRKSTYGQNGLSMLQSISSLVSSLHMYISDYAAHSNILLEDIQSPLQKGHSQCVRHHIDIELDSSGYPNLPHITSDDLHHPYLTKDVQDMVREYCAAHIRESYSIFKVRMTHMSMCDRLCDRQETPAHPMGRLHQRTIQVAKEKMLPKGFPLEGPFQDQNSGRIPTYPSLEGTDLRRERTPYLGEDFSTV